MKPVIKVGFYFYKAQMAKLIDTIRSLDSGYLLGKVVTGFWGAGNILLLDLVDGFIGLLSWRKCIELFTYKRSTFLNVYIL